MRELKDALAWIGGTLLIAGFLIGCGVLGMLPGAIIQDDNNMIVGMVIGGLGSVWGAILGGLLVGLVETLSIHFLGATSIQVTVWGLLLVLLIVRPQGLFGHNAIGKGKF